MQKIIKKTLDLFARTGIFFVWLITNRCNVDRIQKNMKTLSFDFRSGADMATFVDLLLALQTKGVKYELTQDNKWVMVHIG
jgi:hypothetical protein